MKGNRYQPLPSVNSNPAALELLLGIPAESGKSPELSKRGRVYTNQSVSFPPGLLAKAKERARRLGLAFSAYVQKCVERDLEEGGSIVFSEREEPARAAAEEAGPVAPPPKARQRGRS